MVVRSNNRDKVLSLLEQYDDCPSRTRNNIDELIAIVLENAENDVNDMLCDQNLGNYQGLDINRDTIKEVETIVRFFPNLLSKRKEVVWGTNENDERGWINAKNGEGEYPIQCLSELCGPNSYRCNFKAIPFVAVLARSGIELDQLAEEEERGGLLIEDRFGDNTLQNLALMSDSSDEEEHIRMDTVCLSQFIQLQRMGLFIQADIPRYSLVHNLCYRDHFAENAFQFLVNWYPTSLVHIDEDGDLPLHVAAQESTIEGFRTVFEYIIHYYPTKKGISSLFTKNNSGETAFQIACQKHGRDVVMRIVENILNNSDLPINVIEVLALAATHEEIDLDCVYFLFRREPDVLVRQQLPGPNNNDSGGDDDNGDDNDGDNVDHTNEGYDDDHVDDNDEDEDNANDHNEDMNDGDDDDDTGGGGADNDGDGDDTDGADDDDDGGDGDATNGADNDDDDDRNYSNNDIVRNKMNDDEGVG